MTFDNSGEGRGRSNITLYKKFFYCSAINYSTLILFNIIFVIYIYLLLLFELINCKLVCENEYMYQTINLAFNFTKYLCNKKKYCKDYVIKGYGYEQNKYVKKTHQITND